MASRKVGAPPKQISGQTIKHVDIQNVKPQKLTKLERQARRELRQSRTANSMGMGGVGGGPNAGPASIRGADSGFFSPQLSTDFLELPQSDREKRELFRFYYLTNEIVGSAIDSHTDIPLSKIRLSIPKGKDPKRNRQILHFFEGMCKRMKLFQGLYDATHSYWLFGAAHIMAEDQDIKIPGELIANMKEEEVGEIDFAGRPQKRLEVRLEPKPEHEQVDAIRKYVQEHYQGWQNLRILPSDQIRMEVFSYTDMMKMELIPAEKDRMIVMKAKEGDLEALKIAESIPEEIRDNIESGQPISLNTNPYDDYFCSSFCYYLAHKRLATDDKGVSLLERCLRTLTVREKYRQAQTSIASRAMTPKRVVWGDKMSVVDVEDLRDQVDQALIDPDFSIIANFEVHWDEIGARDRVLDLSAEYEHLDKLLYAGLRTTESILTGESSYSGERIHLDVMNTMYLGYRERLVEYVEDYLFAPVAEKKGFFEIDEDGNRVLLFPKVKFTRLALRDNTELQDFMFNLYSKNSLPIEYIYDLINVDVDDATAKLEKDMFTVRDSIFNEAVRRVYEGVAEKLISDTDVLEKIIKSMNLKSNENKGDRFASDDSK